MIIEDLEFCQTWNLEWEVKYHDNSPFRLFSEKSNIKFFSKQYKMSFFRVLAQIRAKMNFMQKLVLLLQAK